MGPSRRDLWGRRIFRQSVWYDDKDNMLLDKKPHDVVGTDALAENIISAESSDEDE